MHSILGWFKKGTWTVLDQGLFAGSNFLLNILLVRWLSAEGYGIFTIAYTLFLLIGAVHTGLLTEPMLVFGPSKYKDQLPAYWRVLLRGHITLTICISLGLWIAGFALQYTPMADIASVLMVLALVQPVLLFLWLMRRACYVVLQPAWAASGGFIYAGLVLLGLYGLYQMQWLSANMGLGLMGVVSGMAGLWIMRFLRVQRKPVANAFVDEVHRQHWDYGKWASATGLLTWVPGHLAFLVLPIWGGLEASGALRALLNFIMPASHIYGALAVLLVPVFVKAREKANFKRFVALTIGGVVLGTSVYWVLLGAGGEWLIGFLYGGQYHEYAHLLWLVGALPVMAGIGSVLRTTLRAIEQPKQVFWAYLGSSGVAVTVGIWLIMQYGITGAIASFFAQMVIEIGFMVYFFLRPQPMVSATNK